MKTKRRTGTNDNNMYSKKIVTRNMKNKLVEEKSLSVPTTCNSLSSNKASPNTRAKSISTMKPDSDPYSFCKMDEECKIPLKKMKMTEKTSKDMPVNMCSQATMIDQELLGPCEPGTSISLQGVVWLETETGLLVINVTWKGRTYVGTLLDSSKYEPAAPFNSLNCPIKQENLQHSRTNRNNRSYLPTSPNYHNSLRSNSIRHSRRLTSSFSSSDTRKKSSSRLSQNMHSCYVDSLSLSADASNSGESDSERNVCKKYSLTNKTRSITRSLAKQRKDVNVENVANRNESDLFKNVIKCTQAGCFKQFTNHTALHYHLQRCHDVFEDVVKIGNPEDNVNTNISNSVQAAEKEIKQESFCNGEKNESCKTLNGIIKVEKDNYEFLSDSDTKGFDNELRGKPKEKETSDVLLLKTDTVKNEKDEPSMDSLRFPKTVMNNPVEESPIKDYPLEDKTNHLTATSSLAEEVIQNNIVKVSESTTSDLTTSSNHLVNNSNHAFRTVTAPTVSIPIDPSPSITCPNISSSPSISTSLIKPKPNEGNISHTGKVKQPKIFPLNHGTQNFQIPSSNVLSKKRPLIPLQVVVSQNSTTNQNRVSSNSANLMLSSQNHLSRTIRSVSNVTPILPATTVTHSLTQTLSTSTSASGLGLSPGLVSTSFPTTSSYRKPPATASNNTSPSTINSLLSLKPIQPKPKLSCTISTHTNTTSTAMVTSPSSTPGLPSGILSNQTSYQRQILPSPVSKQENGNFTEERPSPKIEIMKSPSVKKKRRKSDTKSKVNFQDNSKNKKTQLNSIQPKQGCDTQDFMSNHRFLSSSLDSYKMDEENSHSPDYSDHSETNDTPAPILEKEIELKSGDCDKLIICTDDFEIPESPSRISTPSSENGDETKDSLIYNRPPALMPAVLSTDLLNVSTNDIDLSDSSAKTARRKLPTSHKPSKFETAKRETLKSTFSTKVSSEIHVPSTIRHNNSNTSTPKSFQSFSLEDPKSSSLISLSVSTTSCSSSSSSSSSLSKLPLHNSSGGGCNGIGKNSKSKFPNKCSNLSAINDYVWMTKNNPEPKPKEMRKVVGNPYSVKPGNDGQCGKIKVIQSNQANQTNWKFSVKALTSPQDIVSRTFTSSSTEISLNPDTKLANSLSKD